MIRFRPLSVLLAQAFVTLVSAVAAAAPPDPEAQAATSTSVDDDDENADAPVPLARDLVTGHLQLSAGGQFEFPFAKLDTGTAFAARADSGAAAMAQLAFGVSRNAAIGVWGNYAAYGETSRCRGCDRAAFAVGPFVRYHPVQGFRFDPWVSLGVGYRSMPGGQQQTDYAGLDWLRLSFGGDWYALSQVAFGPYTQLALGTFTKRTPHEGTTVYGLFSAGLAVTFDLQGK